MDGGLYTGAVVFGGAFEELVDGRKVVVCGVCVYVYFILAGCVVYCKGLVPAWVHVSPVHGFFEAVV